MWVVTDEIYEHLVYGAARFTLDAGAGPRAGRHAAWSINGVAKTYAMTGWRVGWMIGPPDVIAAAANLQSHATSNVCNVAQRAALAAVSGDLEAVAEMRSAYDRRRRTIVAMLNDIPGVRCPEPEGAFYAFPSMEGLLGRPLGGRTAARRTLELADARPRRGPGGLRAGRGVRRPGLRPLLLRPRRRGAGGGDHPPGQARRRLRRPGVARVLVTEEIAEPGLALLRAAGHEVDVSLGLSAAELLDAVPGGRRPDHPVGDPGDAPPCWTPRPSWWWWAGPASASTTWT